LQNARNGAVCAALEPACEKHMKERNRYCSIDFEVAFMTFSLFASKTLLAS
jgi:hypothetical protein